MKLRTVHPNELQWIEQALFNVVKAQELLRHARCPRAHKAVAKVRKSVEGALRHAQRVYDAEYYAERRAAEAVDRERLVVVRCK